MTSRVFNVGGTVPGTHPHISSFAKLSLPIITALTGAYVFGGNTNLSLRNRANPARPLLQVGTPVIAPLFGANVQHENCFDTVLTPSASRTWIVIYKPQALTGAGAANKAPLLGNHVYVGANLRGDQMFMGDPSALYNQADRNNTTAGSVAQSISGLNTARWAAAVGIVDGVGGTLDSARRQSGVHTWANPIPTFTGRATYADRNIRIGGDGTGTPGIYSRAADIGMVVIHEAPLLRAEVVTQLDYINGWLTTNYGITDLAA